MILEEEIAEVDEDIVKDRCLGHILYHGKECSKGIFMWHVLDTL